MTSLKGALRTAITEILFARLWSDTLPVLALKAKWISWVFQWASKLIFPIRSPYMTIFLRVDLRRS
jgi:hypothetical protein